MKIFWLRYNYLELPRNHRVGNGCPIAEVIVYTKNKKRLIELLGTSMYNINTYGNAQVVTGDEQYGVGSRIKEIPEELQEDVIWYKPECIDGGYNKDKWFKYQR